MTTIREAWPNGIACRFEVRSNAGTLHVLGTMLIEESAHGGSRLQCDVDLEAASPPSPGEPVTVTFEPLGDGLGGTTSIRLWCRSVRHRVNGRGASATIEAVDPLSLCDHAHLFRSYAGRVALGRLLKQVLSNEAAGLQSPPACAVQGPTFDGEWLLQCQEMGREFVRRIATALGVALYWDGDDYAVAPLGKGPDGAAGVRLAFGESLVSFETVEAPDLDPQRHAWVAPDTRAVTAITSKGRGLGGGAVLACRAAGVVRPASSGIAEAASAEPIRGAAVARTYRADVRLGTGIMLPNGTNVAVDSVTHVVRAGGLGSYFNIASGAAPGLWGVPVSPPARGLLGPFQGRVSHNDDPARQGRVRVTLEEDVTGRTTPWLANLAFAAGASTGLHFVPDVGELVLLGAEAAAPENLVCLGAVRGRDQKIDPPWRSPSNGKKVIAANGGLLLEFDEEQKAIRLVTPGCSFEMSSDGAIRVTAKRTNFECSESFEVKGGTHVAIDADRIDLG